MKSPVPLVTTVDTETGVYRPCGDNMTMGRVTGEFT